MKKVLITGVIGLFVLAISSCGHGPGCDAYGGAEADYTAYKSEHNEKVEKVKELAETVK